MCDNVVVPEQDRWLLKPAVLRRIMFAGLVAAASGVLGLLVYMTSWIWLASLQMAPLGAASLSVLILGLVAGCLADRRLTTWEQNGAHLE